MKSASVSALCAICALFPGLAHAAAIGPIVRTFGPQTGLEPGMWSPNGYTGIAMPGFDASLGTLRCVEVTIAQTWFTSGELCVIRLPGSGAGTVSGTLQGNVTLGFFDGTGFTFLAGDTGTGGSASHSFPAGVGTHCGTAFGGGGSHATTSATGYHYLFGGPPPIYATHGAGISFTPPFPQGVFPTPNGGSSSTVATFTFFYIFTPHVLCPGDANNDGVVDFLDLNIVLGEFTLKGPCSAGDVNNDNVVDFLDLNMALGFFGTACTN